MQYTDKNGVLLELQGNINWKAGCRENVAEWKANCSLDPTKVAEHGGLGDMVHGHGDQEST